MALCGCNFINGLTKVGGRFGESCSSPGGIIRIAIICADEIQTVTVQDYTAVTTLQSISQITLNSTVSGAQGWKQYWLSTKSTTAQSMDVPKTMGDNRLSTSTLTGTFIFPAINDIIMSEFDNLSNERVAIIFQDNIPRTKPTSSNLADWFYTGTFWYYGPYSDNDENGRLAFNPDPNWGGLETDSAQITVTITGSSRRLPVACADAVVSGLFTF